MRLDYSAEKQIFDFVIESVKFIGGLGGLASAAFLIYDRIFRYRPSVFLIPANYKPNLRFRNVAAETIIIDEIIISPPILRVARANDLVTRNEESAAVMYPSSDDNKRLEGIFVVIKPMDERMFALHRLADFENAAGNTSIAIRCRWRNTRKPFPINRYENCLLNCNLAEK